MATTSGPASCRASCDCRSNSRLCLARLGRRRRTCWNLGMEADTLVGLPDGIPPMSTRWVAILRGESALAFTQRAGRRLFGLMPCASRCKFCNAPFKGRYAGAFRTVGYTPSRKNPKICARCIERAPEGGAIVPVTVLFADVRGYTSLCEQLDPDELTDLVQHFYETSSSALLAQEGLLGQIVGDVTNVAARLTASARDGEIVIDSNTYEDVARAFPDATREDLALKGKRDPVAAYWIPP